MLQTADVWLVRDAESGQVFFFSSDDAAADFAKYSCGGRKPVRFSVLSSAPCLEMLSAYPHA